MRLAKTGGQGGREEEGSDFSAPESGYTMVPFTAIAKAGGGGQVRSRQV